MKLVPCILSFCRILLSLFMLFVRPLTIIFYAIYIICGATDFFDGFIARKAGATSKFGAKLDSIADMIMIGVLLIVIFPIVHPSQEIIIWTIFIAIIKVTSIYIGFKKYKTLSMLHTICNKITGAVLLVFPLLLSFIHGTELMYMICILATIAATEELIIQLTSNQIELNRKSILIKEHKDKFSK